MHHFTTFTKAALVVLLGFAGHWEACQAQVKNAVKLNVLSIGVSTLSGFYERAVGSHWSLQLGVLYTPQVGTRLQPVTIGGFGITPEVRFYTQRKKQALEGLYIGSFLRYRHNPLTYRDSFRDPERLSFQKNTIGAGLLVGYQLLVLDKHLSLDFFGGPHLNRHFVQAEDNSQSYNYRNMFYVDPVGFRVGVTIGYAFQ